MMMNIIRPAASTAGPKAIRHRPGILNFSLQPSFLRADLKFEKRNLSKTRF
jgi:hypothetical protein